MMSFATLYKNLNPEQKQAVDTVEGPVMVIAGPGTGKTQVLAMRTANILKKTHARPSNILCLTFSTAGATAMRERLRTLIGGDAYGVTVSTVHGFCDSIIRRHSSLFSDWSASTPISDLEKYKVLQKILDTVSHTSALINAKNPYDRISAILGRISDCKREGKSHDDLLRTANEYDTQMEEKSKKGTKQYQKNILQARKFRDFIDIFDRYQNHLTENGLYDYDDMILVVLQALKDEDWLLSGLQERYQYILVDEAQDLNGAQWKVMETLTSYGALYHEPNLFIVGDDDQSIYRFQGANMAEMLRFHERFPSAPIIVLTTNYRSTQSILDAAGRLITQNEERLIGKIPGLHKDLKAFTKDLGPIPSLLRPPSDSAEPWLIADLIDERVASGIPPEEIAVLVQTNAELFPIYDVLRAREIPVILQGKSDLLQHPIVLEACTILKFVQSHGDNSLLHALACSCFGCRPEDLARISFYAREKKLKVENVLLSLETLDLHLTDSASVLSARGLLFDYYQKKESRTILQTVEHILRESGLSSSAHAKSPLDLAAIEAFFQYIKQYCLDHPTVSLHVFLHDLALYGDENIGNIRLTYQLPHLVTSGVQLLSAHQSKGLEFHTVIIAGFREGHWDDRSNTASLALPEELLFGWESEQKRYEKHQDERRVAYVAMTRAKRELIMLCPREFSVGERSRPVAPSAFFAEAGPLPESDASLQHPEASSLLLLHPQPNHSEELLSYIKERIAGFSLSPTSLTRFLDDPQEFLRIEILGQPEEFTETSLRSMAYGSAVHWALRDWGSSEKRDEYSVDDFLKAFEWYLTEKTILTEIQKRDLLAQAKEALPIYFSSRLSGSSPIFHGLERDVRAHLIDPKHPSLEPIPIKGKLDRIDLASPNSSDAIIIDYKTGRPKAPSEIRGCIEEGKVSRTAEGSYFRQMVFYALLLELADPLLTPQVYRFEFIGERGEEPIIRDFKITQAEKDDLRALIRAVWSKITEIDFTPL